MALWTHNMQNLEYHASFEAYNCPAANAQNVGILGAGVVGKTVVDFFTSQGMQVAIGAVGQIGVAGGFGQGGGHGAFGPTHGKYPINS